MKAIDTSSILVPLDGSVYAEAVFPSVLYFLNRCGSSVTLMHLVEINPPEAIHGQRHIGSEAEAREYLDEAAKRLGGGLEESKGKDLPERIRKLIINAGSANVAREISRQCADSGLTILCTHGRSGLEHLWSGSIAQKTVRLSRKPLLLIHPDHAQFDPKKIVIPLDGDPAHEESIEAAIGIAVLIGVPIELILVIPTLSTVPSRASPIRRMLPFMTQKMLEMEQEEATEYLRAKKAQVCESLASTPACADSDFRVLRGDPAAIIRQTVLNSPDSLLVLGTHGRSGFQAFWEGSVASRVGTSLRYPMLLVPVA